MKQTRASTSKQRQMLSIELAVWAKMAKDAETRPDYLEADREERLRQVAFYRQEADRLRGELRQFGTGTRAQQKAGFASGYRG